MSEKCRDSLLKYTHKGNRYDTGSMLTKNSVSTKETDDIGTKDILSVC